MDILSGDTVNSAPETQSVSVGGWLTPWRAACGLIMAIAGLIYAGCLGGSLVWDDHVLVNGDGIGGGDSLLHCFTHPFLDHYYRPLVSVSFYLEHFLWGYKPLGYHITNLILHILGVGVFILLLREIFESRRIALIGGLIFALQPTQVSTIAWIGGRTDSMCELWILLFGYFLVRAARQQGDKRSFAIAASVFCYLVALLIKEQMLPMLLLVPMTFRFFPPRRGYNLPRTEWWATLPFAITAILFLVMGYFLGMPRPHGARHSLADIIVVSGRALSYYTLVLFTPTPRWLHTLSLGAFDRMGLPAIIGGFASLGAACALFVRWCRTCKPAAWFTAWMLLAILPVSNLMPLPFLQVSPYRGGVAGLGSAALIAWLFGRPWKLDAAVAGRIWRWLGERADALRGPVAYLAKSPVQLTLLAIVVLWYGTLTAWGATRWTTDERIFTTIVHYDYDSCVARYTLASMYVDNKKDALAAQQLEIILQQLFGKGNWRSGEKVMDLLKHNETVRKRVCQNQGSSDDPRWWVALMYGQLGLCRVRTDHLDSAVEAWRAGDLINPDDPDVNLGLGYAAYLNKNYTEAERRLRRCLSVDPYKTYGHVYLGYTYAAMNRWGQAANEFAIWADAEPNSVQACLALANAQRRIGDLDATESTLYEALRRSPSNTDARAMLQDLDGGGQSRPFLYSNFSTFSTYRWSTTAW